MNERGRLPMVFHRPVRLGAAAAPDGRGNNPHGTRESADAEGRRRNAGRYETVGQLDRALDRRLQPGLGDPRAPAPASGGLMGFFLLAVAGAVLYTLAKGTDDDDGDGDGDAPRQNPGLPPPTPPQNTQFGVPVMLFMQPPTMHPPTMHPPTMPSSGATPAPSALTPSAVLAPEPRASVDVPQPETVVVVAVPPTEPAKRKRALGPNRGRFTSRTAKKARAKVQHPGPAPKVTA